VKKSEKNLCEKHLLAHFQKRGSHRKDRTTQPQRKYESWAADREKQKVEGRKARKGKKSM